MCFSPLAAAPEKTRKRPAGGARSRVVEVRYDPAEINNAATRAPFLPGSEGPAVVRAQILLDRARISPGEIDGKLSVNFQRALAGFAASRNLSGEEAIWQALNADNAPALVPYRITEDDLKGPFERIPEDMMEKAELTYLGYQSPLEAVAEKFHVSPRLLRALNPGMKIRVDEDITVPNVATESPGKAASVVVSRSTRTVAAFDAAGKLMSQYPATIGSEHDPLPVGDWKITGVFRNPHFNYNPELFWDADPSHSKAKLPPGPNSPVGLVWIDLSKEHYGIHGTPEPSRIGHTASHGCIRLTNWDALELADMVEKGTPAILKE
ncbi:MAG: L,D-transpeptidase [Acidobacteria bacterium]|nr:L,D-transpeptidase [Acidobacteriota bacterium]